MTILVTAASRHNATNEVAQAIANTLTRAGLDVVVRRPEEVGHLANYEGVVLGSAIYAGRWLKPAKDLIERTSTRAEFGLPNAGTRLGREHGGYMTTTLTPILTSAPAATRTMVELSGARAHHLFGGRLDRRDLGFAERAMVSMVGAADGDYRPWNEIEAWAEEIAASLNADPRVLQPA